MNFFFSLEILHANGFFFLGLWVLWQQKWGENMDSKGYCQHILPHIIKHCSLEMG
jgi:hypothetical protein